MATSGSGHLTRRQRASWTGVAVDQTFTDKASGKDTNRPQLEQMLRFARSGDSVIVHSMDRLARNLDDLRRIVQTLTGKAVRIEFVKERLTFTGEDLPMANLLLSAMGAFADDAECAVMRSDPTGTQECPGLRRRSASHNLRPQRGICVRAALPSWPVAVWTEAISDAPINVTFRSSTSASLG